MKAMFLPLKSQYFDAFKTGTKTVEYRRYCKRWDERTCAIGRPVVLSRGYGKHDRLSGVISGFERRHMGKHRMGGLLRRGWLGRVYQHHS